MSRTRKVFHTVLHVLLLSAVTIIVSGWGSCYGPR
jgi:hypothetical protein